MDWDLEELKDLTICVIFTKGNKTIFTASTWAGYIGVLTGAKPNVCTIAINYRRVGDGILTNFTKSIFGSWPIGFLIRHLLENENSYDKIRGYLMGTELISPCYLTMSGKNGQGHLICRLRSETDKIKQLGVNKSDYIIQTNIDYDLVDRRLPIRVDKKVVENILYSKERIKKVESILKPQTQCDNISDITKLVEMFNVWPVMNEETIYITVMQANGKIHTFT